MPCLRIHVAFPHKSSNRCLLNTYMLIEQSYLNQRIKLNSISVSYSFINAIVVDLCAVDNTLSSGIRLKNKQKNKQTKK